MTASRPPSSLFQTGLATPDPDSQSNASGGVIQHPTTSDNNRNNSSGQPGEHLIQGSKNRWLKTKIFRLKNQTLGACRPVFNEKSASILFFAIALIFIPIGSIYIKFNKDMNEITLDYTDCYADDGTNCKSFVLDINNQMNGLSCECKVNFSIFTHMDKDVYMYYGLNKFYQNHRRYVESRDDNQLLGRDIANPSDNCDPFSKAFDKNLNETLPVVPCGVIANSLFNDTFKLDCLVEGGPSVPVPLLKTGIARSEDKNHKFKNPTGTGSLESLFTGTTKPANWHKYIWELDPDNPGNNGLVNEDLIVWMRTAAFPQFRKPHRRVDHNTEAFKNGLPTGAYILYVNYSYPVSQFKGKKSIILTSKTVVGTFDAFLGVMYIVAGVLSFFMGIFVVLLHFKYSLSKRIMQANPEPKDLGSSMAHLKEKVKSSVRARSSRPQMSN